ncbi:MAG: rRNA maturation RNase YbeY [Magnetospirillum sp.]|nr:rRNA maturation RNase YbeY [Magnetospirillum sp.]
MSEPEIAVDLTCPAWAEALPEVEDLCRRVAAAALGAGACDDGPLELSLVLADDATVRDLNRTWRGQDKATNVLSFAALDDDAAPLPEGAPLLLGDVIIAFETCAREAADEGKSLDDHLSHLVVHGVLHLIGFDHRDDAAAEEMEGLETAILGALGIGDPYAEAAR